MRATIHRLVLGLVSAGLIQTAVARQTTADLRPKFEKGQETRYRMDIASEGVTESPDPEADPLADPKGTPSAPGKANDRKGMGTIRVTQKMTQSLGLRFRVVNVDAPKTATVELIYDSLRVSMDGPEGKLDFDSDAKPAPGARPAGKKPAAPSPGAAADSSPAANLSRVVGSTLTLTIDKDGNITKVSGGEGLVPSTPGDPSSTLVTPAGVKELWGPIFTMRKASGSASVGEKWKTTDTMDASPLGRFSITTESVLKSMSGPTASVDFKGTITPAVESAGGLMGFQVKDSTHDGSYRWDTGRGMLQSLDMTQVVEVEGGAQGFRFSSKSTTKTSVKRVE